MRRKLFLILTNFSAAIFLLGLLVGPFYFAHNFANVAGVKSETPFLLVSQIEKFPNMTFSQNNDRYVITFNKISRSQAFLDVLVLNNPTDKTQSYSIDVTSGNSHVFFGEDLQNLTSTISLPSQTSVPVSLLSDNPGDTSVEFIIITN